MNIPNPEEIKKFMVDLDKEIRQTDREVYSIQRLEEMKQAYAAYCGEDKLISSADILAELEQENEETFYQTGFTDFDRIVKGFWPQQLVVISAATGSGKTSFCIDLTARWKQYNPVWLPFEESARELVRKFKERGEAPPHFYTPSSMIGDNLLWVEKKIIEGIAKYDSKVVFIDHLHYLVPIGENMSQQIGFTMRALKQMAKRWNIVIFLIAHLKKTRTDSQPTKDDLRDSSFIAQEADTVILLWREEYTEHDQVVITNNVNVSVQKTRRTGSTGNVKMRYENGKFIEEDWRYKEKQDVLTPKGEWKQVMRKIELERRNGKEGIEDVL